MQQQKMFEINKIFPDVSVSCSQLNVCRAVLVIPWQQHGYETAVKQTSRQALGSCCQCACVQASRRSAVQSFVCKAM